MSFRIERLGHHGDGIAEGPVFAPMTLPGEGVDGTLVGDRLTQVKILEPSSDRVRPPCRHFNQCGGCALQHASDAFVEAWKRGVVETALAARGIAVQVRAVHTSPPHSRRRATFAGRRTKKSVLLGFHARASDTVVDIPDCTLLHPDLRALFPFLAEIVTEFGSRKGTVTLSVTRSETGADIVVEGAKTLLPQDLQTIGGLCETHGVARVIWTGDPVFQRTAPIQVMGRARVAPPSGAFLQATHQGQAALTASVQEATQGAGRIADLFAGCGTFSLPLAEGAEVHAVEGDGPMLAALMAGHRTATGLKPVTTEARDLFRRPLMPDELKRFDAVVIDPPRAGAEAQCAELARSPVGRIAYVSCNPVTFARDVQTLISAGFRLNWVDVVDQFRWSPHIEIAACLTRA